MNCLTYARVSTQEQAERELSLPAQQQAMREYATRHGWNVVGEFVEAGVTGTTAKRPALQQLLARCRESAKVDVVLVHKVDRLARNVFDHATIRMVLKQRSIKLASVVENVDDTVSGQLVENIMASIAQFYSANLGEETKKGMRQMVQRGSWPWKAPRGYTMGRDASGHSQVVVDVGIAPAVRRIFELYATGSWSLAQLSQELATLGVRTPAARLVSVESVRRLLLNPFYAGWVYWGETRYRGKHEPLVSQETFGKVQRILQVRYRDCGEKGRLHFWLRGAAVCAECGARMTAERHGKWSYYRCVRNVQSTRDCRARFVSTDKAHLAVGQLLRRLRVSSELNVAIVKEAEKIVNERGTSLNRDRASLRVRHARLQEQEQRLTEGFAQGVVSLTAYKATVAKVQQQLAVCDHALALTRSDPKRQLEKLSRILNVATSVWDYHGQLKGKAQTQLLRLVFKSITLDTTGVVSYALEVPFDSLLRDASEGTTDGDSRSAHLEDTRLRAAIRDIFEFDEAPLRQLLDQTIQETAA